MSMFNMENGDLFMHKSKVISSSFEFSRISLSAVSLVKLLPFAWHSMHMSLINPRQIAHVSGHGLSLGGSVII
jgi:hypothetical protein